ncbi:hypothetical protein F1D05_25265 [Kribbella qitaiheensis]|uniref:Metalloprotease n=1 Tax=Kribbella qitaiheensis TaxID=1544730 RepID=A0A7G6X2Z9_9ACTN|nr:neutral zinc metallopeptidase [Kribbella qitaiheensis]QNE20614.1 hypothetical protein F1D05_25265 [Kribbella qitaiheensis]
MLLTIIPRSVTGPGCPAAGTVLPQEDALSNEQPYGGQQPPYQGPPQQWGAPQYPPTPPQYGGGGPQYPPPAPQYGSPQYGGQQYGGQPQYGGQQFAGPPPGGPGFGWGPGGPQQPKKKSKGWLVIPVVLVIGVVGLWVAGVISKNHQADNYADPQPTYTSTTDPTNGPTNGPTDEPTVQPTGTGSTEPVPTKTSPPPPRKPTPYEVVSRSKFYRTGVQPGIGCRESGARATTFANAIKYYAVVKACADKGWPRQVRSGGSTFTPPKTIVISGQVQSPCGGNAPSSYYCGANQTIYMAGALDVQRNKQYRGAQNQALLRAGMSFTVAHEYAHHIQELTGILDASDTLGYATGTTAGRWEASRRLELQASCLGGVFLAANKASYPFTGLMKSGLDYWTNNSGDEADPNGERIHGTMKNHGYWFHRGYNSRNIAACNTFLAPSSQVS